MLNRFSFRIIFALGAIAAVCGTGPALAQRDSASLWRDIKDLEVRIWEVYPVVRAKAIKLQEEVMLSSCEACKGRSYMLVGKYFWANGEYPEGLKYFRQSMVIAKRVNDRDTYGDVLDLIALTYYYQAYYDSAVYYFNESFRNFEERKNYQGMIKVLHNTALMYHRKGDFKKTIEYLFKEEKLKDQQPQSVHYVESMGAMGNLMIDSIYYREEIRDETADLKRYLEKNDKASAYRTYHNIAKAHRQLKEYKTSARYFVKAAKIMQELNEPPRWNGAGHDYRDSGMKDSSFYYFYLSKSMMGSMTQTLAVETIESLADTHLHFEQLDSALYYYKRAMVMNLQMNNRITITGIHRMLVRVYAKLGKYEIAEQHLKEGLALAKEVALIHEVNLYEEGKDLYEAKGDYRKALSYGEQYMLFMDSLHRQETAFSLTKLQAEFKTAKKDSEIKGLQQVNLLGEEKIKTRNLQILLASGAVLVIAGFGISYYSRYRSKGKSNELLERQKMMIEQQNSILTDQNKEKGALLSEIHHRVKNNLQIISSLVNLKSKQVSSETAQVLQQLNGRIFSMGLIHEKLYQTENIQLIRMDVYLGEIASYLLGSFEDNDHPIGLELNCEPIEIGVEHALTCGLICNELITNSVKYAFPPDQIQRSILLQLSNGNGSIQLTVSDNGRSADALPGTFEKSFGLRFVDQLVKSKLGGEWSMKLEKGFHATIVIPNGIYGEN